MNRLNSACERLLQAIGYPMGEIPPGGAVMPLKVDGRDFLVREDAGRLVLSCVLLAEPDEESLARCSGYAVGRMLKEEAVLAWDPASASLILWQGVSAGASDAVLRRFFEVFATSADWWFARTRDMEMGATIPEMVIRP